MWWCGIRHPRYRWACMKIPGHKGPHSHAFEWYDKALEGKKR